MLTGEWAAGCMVVTASVPGCGARKAAAKESATVGLPRSSTLLWASRGATTSTADCASRMHGGDLLYHFHVLLKQQLPRKHSSGSAAGE
jgi:hypothetical protein